MENQYYEHPGKIKVFTVLKRAASALTGKFMLIAGLTLIGFLPVALNMLTPYFKFLLLIPSIILGFLMQGSVAMVMVNDYQEEETKILECLKNGLARVVVVVKIIFLTWLIIIIPAILIGVGAAMAAARSGTGYMLPTVLILGGLLFMVWFFLAYGQAYLLCVAAQLGALESFSVSKVLTKGHKAGIFLTFLAMTIISTVVYTAGAGLLAIVFVAPGTDLQYIVSVISSNSNFNAIIKNSGSIPIFLFLLSLVQCLVRIVSTTIIGALYVELLICQQDKDLADKSEVFA
ncbi:MAG: hypothetical protein LBP22_00800 [Deltaproteobacteria bacterium]|jgi:hypothetical protein|nr:hypothetical protein [Deltaproteobacteria bacterium]